MRTTLITVVLVMLGTRAVAGEQPRYFTADPKVDFFSTSTRLPISSKSFPGSIQSIVRDSIDLPPLGVEAKSPWLAGVLSLALPGAGELYSESYVKSGIFFAVEVAAWIVAFTFDKKGDRQTNLFQDFADVHWSVVSYAMWLNAHRGQNVGINPDASLLPWERVDWVELNTAERQVASGPQGYGFTHVLPPHGEQQYYELIGKYDQYSTGWDDFTGGSDFFMISPRFRDYSLMRGKANDFYNIASTAVGAVVVNHVLSAVDAFFTASGFNKSLHAEARVKLRHTPFGLAAEMVGTVNFKF